LHDDEIGIGGHASIVALENARFRFAGFAGFARFRGFAGLARFTGFARFRGSRGSRRSEVRGVPREQRVASLYETDAETWPRVEDLIGRGNPKNPLP